MSRLSIFFFLLFISTTVMAQEGNPDYDLVQLVKGNLVRDNVATVQFSYLNVNHSFTNFVSFHHILIINHGFFFLDEDYQIITFEGQQWMLSRAPRNWSYRYETLVRLNSDGYFDWSTFTLATNDRFYHATGSGSNPLSTDVETCFENVFPLQKNENCQYYIIHNHTILGAVPDALLLPIRNGFLKYLTKYGGEGVIILPSGEPQIYPPYSQPEKFIASTEEKKFKDLSGRTGQIPDKYLDRLLARSNSQDQTTQTNPSETIDIIPPLEETLLNEPESDVVLSDELPIQKESVLNISSKKIEIDETSNTPSTEVVKKSFTFLFWEIIVPIDIVTSEDNTKESRKPWWAFFLPV